MPFVSWPVKQEAAVGLFEVEATNIKTAFQRGTRQRFFLLALSHSYLNLPKPFLCIFFPTDPLCNNSFSITVFLSLSFTNGHKKLGTRMSGFYS